KDVTAFLLQEARQKSTIDIIEDFAGPLPVIIIAEMLGAPIEDRHLIKTYSDVLVAGAKDSSDKAVADMVHNRRDGHAFLS
ncbi:cytochrome P450, partial [Bacillus spizizenii]|nr:cytochrome P450 [Bacillus spizizenii]